MYLTTYVDGKKGVDTLDGFSDQALDYIENIYEDYYELTGHDASQRTSSDGSWSGMLVISSTFSEESDSFDALLSIFYTIPDYYDNNLEFSTYDHYHLTFDLNRDNKFDITERALYENIDLSPAYFDGTSAFFNIYNQYNDITSFNLKTGEYKNETLLQSNREFYFDKYDSSYINWFKQTDSYGLTAGSINSENKLVLVENFDKENHSVLFEIDHENSGNSYFDDVTENKYGTLNVVVGNSTWTYSEDYKIRSAEENYELYSYKKNGDLNKIDLGTYETYYEYKGDGWTDWDEIAASGTDFFLWNDNDADTWLVKEYRNKTNGKGYSYFEGFVLDDDFNIDSEADLTLTLEIDDELDNSGGIGSAADNNGFHAGFIFSTTEAEYDYEQERTKTIVSKIQEANSWDKINYKTYDWSEVNYDTLSDYETEKIRWNKVDLELALESDNFRFDAIDWEEIKNKGGVNKKAHKLINKYLFDDDDDYIDLKHLTSKKIQAGGGNDSIIGNSLNNIFYGQDGDDNLNGDSGKDKLYGQDGDDILDGGISKDKLFGGAGNDELYGGYSADKLYGEDGDDYLDGGTSKDKVYGGNGNDELHGGTGKDFLSGGEDEDTLYGDGGNDKLMGEGGEDILYGGNGKDFLRGGEDEDTLYGESGNDKIMGGDGNDILVGGLGKDNLYGGSGNDVFKLTEGIGYDRIRDFKKGEDRVDIAEYDINELGVFDSGKNIKVYLDENQSDLLAIIYKNNIDDGSISEFIF